MRSIALAIIILFHGSCKKDSGNELPLEEVRGKILYTTGLDMVELDIQSGQSKVITAHYAALPAWSPDGSLLLWSDKINSSGTAVDKITDAQGNAVFEFDNPDVHDACWSPDGKEVAARLAFVRLTQKHRGCLCGRCYLCRTMSSRPPCTPSRNYSI